MRWSDRKGRTTFELSEYAAIKFIGVGQKNAGLIQKRIYPLAPVNGSSEFTEKDTSMTSALFQRLVLFHDSELPSQ
jgi:hypothetical protein